MKKQDCSSCKFWSDRVARSIGGNPTEAHCYKKNAWVSEARWLNCEHYEEGEPVDCNCI
jgi:hypothetical protein